MSFEWRVDRLGAYECAAPAMFDSHWRRNVPLEFASSSTLIDIGVDGVGTAEPEGYRYLA